MMIMATAALSARAEENPQLAQPQLPLITLTIDEGRLIAEVADTQKTRRIGLSHRAELAPDTGMLLVYPAPRQICLWMRDVSFALDAAFLSESGEILAISRMQPHTTTPHCAAAAKYALELPPDWLAKHNINIGNTFTGLPQPE